MKWLVLLMLVAGCGGKVTGGAGGGSVDVGNGGDARIAEWIRIGYEIVGLLRERPIPAVTSERLEGAVRSTVVQLSEKLELNGVVKDAINYPQRTPPTIAFDPVRWDGIEDHHQKIFLVLHEYLGILGVDDSGYRASYQLDQAMVCRRTPAIRIAIENSLKRLCYQLTPPELRFVDNLELYNKDIRELKSFDFYYLTQLRSLDLSGNHLKAIPPGAFRDLHLLKHLDLRLNEIKEFATGTFEGLLTIGNLAEDFYSPIARVAPNFLGNIPQLIALSLCPKDGRITELAPGAFGKTKIYGLALCFDFTKPVAAESFAGTEGLYELYLGGRGMEYLPPGIFKGMIDLETLHLKVEPESVRADQIEELNALKGLRTIILEKRDHDPKALVLALKAYRCSRGSNRVGTAISETEEAFIYCERLGAGDALHSLPSRQERKGEPPRPTVIVEPDTEVITAGSAP